MAKKRRKSAPSARTSSVRTQVIRTPAPIVRVSAPRALPARRQAPRRRRRVGGFGGGGGGKVRSLVNPALAGGAVGMLVKSGLIDKLPAIPVIGRLGAAAIGLSYFGGNSPLVRDMSHGLAFLSGYQLTHDGSISGDDDFSTMGLDTMGDEDEVVEVEEG